MRQLGAWELQPVNPAGLLFPFFNFPDSGIVNSTLSAGKIKKGNFTFTFRTSIFTGIKVLIISSLTPLLLFA
jgi:hypothetical protein